MIPTKCPVTRAFTFYISLLIIYISFNHLIESTPYFPSNNLNLMKVNNYLEIQAGGLTIHLTPYDENETSTFVDPTPNARSIVSASHSRTLDSGWGI